MGAYRLIENDGCGHPDQLLGAHSQATQARMAAESLVLLPQDTSTLNYTGLKRTTGLGPLGEDKGQGLWLHSQLAYRPDGIPLGVLNARCWARPNGKAELERGRNAQSIDQKESGRWVEPGRGRQAARRMIQTSGEHHRPRRPTNCTIVQINFHLHILVRNITAAEFIKTRSFMATQPKPGPIP
jgi:hypothetical protein